MYFLGGCQPSVLRTLFTQRMCLNVFVSYASPSCPITLATVIRTFVFVIASVHHPGVFLAVTSVGKFGTAGVTARLLWLGWHWLPPHGYKKSLHGLLHTGFRFILSQLYYSTTARRSCCDKCGQTWSTFRFFKKILLPNSEASQNALVHLCHCGVTQMPQELCQPLLIYRSYLLKQYRGV